VDFVNNKMGDVRQRRSTSVVILVVVVIAAVVFIFSRTDQHPQEDADRAVHDFGRLSYGSVQSDVEPHDRSRFAAGRGGAGFGADALRQRDRRDAPGLRHQDAGPVPAAGSLHPLQQELRHLRRLAASRGAADDQYAAAIERAEDGFAAGRSRQLGA
jgi:hypothetical protein